MSMLPLLIEPAELQKHLHDPDLLIVDMCKHSQYQQVHIHGAVFLDYSYITAVNRPAMGLLPDEEQISKVLSAIGFTSNSHVVAYDEEGGGKAARLIWTLHALGHFKTSLLNGGLISWYKEKHPVTAESTRVTDVPCKVKYTNMNVIADVRYILGHLDDPKVALLDARSLGEYTGEKRYAERAGRIPGAKHFEWTEGMDPQHNYRLLPNDVLQKKLNTLGLTPDKEIIVYCQTHHRSAFSYFMLKQLGYEKVRGYPGSWSDWGNRLDTPIEI
ncbi:MAG: sulfurtransferase [Gammaproteobacteria bacterium]|jgi:thiosulfate/3-mercaptopyruvate sulfurtransferase|nr:sulfurtransferase [Gammaproteobacteria bacterium]